MDLESAIASHPDVEQVAVIARPHPRWGERPVAYVALRATTGPTTDEPREHTAERVAPWWLPDEFILVEAIPLTGTGKISKEALRRRPPSP